MVGLAFVVLRSSALVMGLASLKIVVEVKLLVVILLNIILLDIALVVLGPAAFVVGLRLLCQCSMFG
jgi:hypothetical protein